MRDKNNRRLPDLKPANHPDRLTQELRKWSDQDDKIQEGVELRQFQDDFGIGFGESNEGTIQ